MEAREGRKAGRKAGTDPTAASTPPVGSARPCSTSCWPLPQWHSQGTNHDALMTISEPGTHMSVLNLRVSCVFLSLHLSQLLQPVSITHPLPQTPL